MQNPEDAGIELHFLKVQSVGDCNFSNHEECPNYIDVPFIQSSL